MTSGVVWKYAIPLRDEFSIEMPDDAQILSAQVQYGEPVMWALVDPSKPKVQVRFRLAGTGHPIEDCDNWMHVGSFQLGRTFVGHLFTWAGGAS